MRNTNLLAVFLLSVVACVDEAPPRTSTAAPEALVTFDCSGDDPDQYDPFCDEDPGDDGTGDPWGGGGDPGDPGWGSCADQTKTATGHGNGSNEADARSGANWSASESAFQACAGSSYTQWTPPFRTCNETTSEDQGVTPGSCTYYANGGYPYWDCSATAKRVCHYAF